MVLFRNYTCCQVNHCMLSHHKSPLDYLSRWFLVCASLLELEKWFFPHYFVLAAREHFFASLVQAEPFSWECQSECVSIFQSSTWCLLIRGVAIVNLRQLQPNGTKRNHFLFSPENQKNDNIFVYIIVSIYKLSLSISMVLFYQSLLIWQYESVVSWKCNFCCFLFVLSVKIRNQF